MWELASYNPGAQQATDSSAMLQIAVSHDLCAEMQSPLALFCWNAVVTKGTIFLRDQIAANVVNFKLSENSGCMPVGCCMLGIRATNTNCIMLVTHHQYAALRYLYMILYSLTKIISVLCQIQHCTSIVRTSAPVVRYRPRRTLPRPSLYRAPAVPLPHPHEVDSLDGHHVFPFDPATQLMVLSHRTPAPMSS